MDNAQKNLFPEHFFLRWQYIDKLCTSFTMRTQRVLKVTKSRSMVNIKQYVYSQYRHTLTKIDARASKNLLHHNRLTVSGTCCGLVWHSGTLLVHCYSGASGYCHSGTLGLWHIDTLLLWHHLPYLHLTQKPRGQYLTKEDIFAFHVAIL